MKEIYESPRAELIDLMAMENLAARDDSDRRNGGDDDIPKSSQGLGGGW